jgi:hypothetical protein
VTVPAAATLGGRAYGLAGVARYASSGFGP